MVGNDVVDLADVDADASTYSPRFDARVFRDEERGWMAAAPDPESARWMLWAAKEAAYKGMKRERDAAVFSPAAMQVDFESTGSAGPDGRTRLRGTVTTFGPAADSSAPPSSAARVCVEVDADAEHVHAAAWREGELAPGFEVAAMPTVEGPGAIEASSFVRRRLVRKLAAALGMKSARLAVGRRERVPIILIDGRPAPIGFSLSHHGRFVACAWSPRDVRRARSLARVDSRAAHEVRA